MILHPIDIRFILEIIKISNVSHIPSMLLTPLIPILSGSSVVVPLNPENWNLVLDGRFAKCCPRVECNECKFKRLVTPRLMLKCNEITCRLLVRTLDSLAFSFIQTAPCDSW